MLSAWYLRWERGRFQGDPSIYTLLDLLIGTDTSKTATTNLFIAVK